MKAVVAAIWILSLAAAFGLGRLGVVSPAVGEPQTLESFRAALRERNPLERSYRLSAFLRQLQPDDIPGFLEAIDEHQIGVTPEEVRLFMLAWARHDGAAAFSWARQWPTPWSQTLSREAAYAWGFHDGPAALAVVEALDDPEQMAQLRASLLEGWLASGDSVRASAYVASVDDERRRRRLLFLLAGETARDGPDAVMRWAEAVPEDAPNDYKTAVFYQATNVLSQEDLRVAVRWLEAHRSRPYSVGSLQLIAENWASDGDVPALFEWLRALPDGAGDRAGERAEALGKGFQAWLQSAPEEAEAWLLRELPAAELDPAVQEMVRARAGPSPTDAFQWVARIQDEERRRHSLHVASRIWLRNDPEAALAWISQSDLPGDVRESLLKSPRAKAVQRRAARPNAVQ